MFTSIFLSYTATLGAIYTVGYAIRAVTEGALAATVGRPVEKIAADGTITVEQQAPGFAHAASVFASELTVPLQGALICAEQVADSISEVCAESYKGASKLFKSKPAPVEAQPTQAEVTEAPLAMAAA